MPILLSRKFLTALVGLILACLSQWAKLPAEVLQAIGVLFSAAVVAIAIDDSGGKLAGTQPKQHAFLEVLSGLLLRNKYFQTAFVGLLATLLVHYSGLPAEVIDSLVILFAATISGGAVEAAARQIGSK